MGLKFRSRKFGGYLSTELPESSSPITHPSLCYRHDGFTHYLPLVPPCGSCLSNDGTTMLYHEARRRTLHVMYRGKHYVVPNDDVSLIDIPAGTYAGYAAFNIFRNFIPLNSFRVLKNTVTVTHCGIRRIFPKGTVVWLTYAYGGNAVNITFSDIKSGMPQAEPGYSSQKQWWKDGGFGASDNPTIQFRDSFRNIWSDIPFTLEQGVVFA